MRILFTINALDIGGAETFLLRLIMELSKQGHETFLYVNDENYNDQNFARYFIEKSKVQVIKNIKKPHRIITATGYMADKVISNLGGRVFYNELLGMRKISYIQEYIKQYKFDIINSHLFGADLFAAKYLKPILKIPHVITMQGCYDTIINLHDDHLKDEAKFVINSCDAMTYVAEKNLSFIKQTGIRVPNISKKIYNGIAAPSGHYVKSRSENNISEDDFVVGQMSRSMEEKGMEISIKALAYLVEEKGIQNIRLVLIGPENDYYKELKTTYAEKEYLLFAGETHDPISWAGMFDVGILPTYFPNESCPSSIIEYLACHKPVITTHVGDIPQMIDSDSGKAGILIEMDKADNRPPVERTAEAILKYYQDKKLYNQHSLHAAKAFEKFDIKKVADTYLEVYQKAIESFIKS